MPRLGIPSRIETITPAWLTTALHASGVVTKAAVTTAGWEPVGTQGWTTQIARFHLRYGQTEGAVPKTLIAKCSAQEAHTRTFFGRFYAREVTFYQQIAADVPLRVPSCYYADYDPATHAHILVLEDLAPAAPGDMVAGVTADVAMAYTRRIATLHAHWWEQPHLETLTAHFPPHGQTFAQGYAARLNRGLWVMQPYLTRATRTLAMGLQQGLQARWNQQYAPPRTLVHWDAHAANVLLPHVSGDDLVVVDWQNCTVARGMWDVARFCIMSLPIEKRRTMQNDIIALYAQTLATYGIRHYSFAQCLADYQTCMPLIFAQQLRFFASMQGWDAPRRAWVEAITPRVAAALHDAADAGLLSKG